jgi:phosphonopyruvate decarboxylase
MNPPNLAIICVDNGHYGETGYQKSHTSLGTDLATMAVGAGIKLTCKVEQQGDIAAGARLIREGNGTAFVLLRVKPTEPPPDRRQLDPIAGRARFRSAVVGE